MLHFILFIIFFLNKKKRDTTGAIILARSVRAATILTRAFKAGSIRKSYIGVTLGVPQFPTGFISCPVEVLDQKTAPRYNKVAGNVILRRELNDADPVAFARMKGNAVSASTTYTVLDTLGSKLALVEFLPHTGRKHQIRVHSAGYLNTPLLGDYMYGPGVKPNIPSISNVTWESTQNDIKMHLHARSIIIPYGNKGKPLVIFAPLPPHFLSTFSKVNFSETKIHDHERGGDTSKVPRVVLSSTGELTATDDSLIKKRKNAEKKQKDKLATMYKKKPSANKENPETIKKKGALAPRAERQQARKARQVKALTKVVDSAAAASVKNPKDTRLLRKVEKAIKKVKDVEADHKKKEKARAKKKYQIKI